MEEGEAATAAADLVQDDFILPFAGHDVIELVQYEVTRPIPCDDSSLKQKINISWRNDMQILNITQSA